MKVGNKGFQIDLVAEALAHNSTCSQAGRSLPPLGLLESLIATTSLEFIPINI
ncbi:unnamed protein product [Enterobius vermicularis]|uniref:Reverse transcriptase domain-containing protein n=1 Tax=Enterobius vermicularis TaxID=51028 RepID=A0A0N4VI94_ENTVE|nr:unnamed protein product [Enterobius vermicularis]